MPQKIACEGKTDSDLVSLTLKDQDYFLCLMEKYQERLLRYIFRLTAATKEDAEDILQDVFIKVYKNLNGYDRKLKFSSWIYRITHNEVISNWRKVKARPDVINSEKTDFILEKITANLDIEKDADDKILRENMFKVLYTLDPKYREVLILRYIEEKDYSEISDILRKPVGTVGTLLNRAKKKLKEEITKGNINLK